MHPYVLNICKLLEGEKIFISFSLCGEQWHTLLLLSLQIMPAPRIPTILKTPVLALQSNNNVLLKSLDYMTTHTKF